LALGDDLAGLEVFFGAALAEVFALRVSALALCASGFGFRASGFAALRGSFAGLLA
jgi:hypothetical protein